MFIVKEIDNKNTWEEFFEDIEDKTFLQSWNWGEFQKRMGNKIWRLGVFEGENLITLALVVKIQAKRGTFLLVQHGPTIKSQMPSRAKRGKAEDEEKPQRPSNLKSQIFKVLLEELKKIGKNEGASFIRISPLLKDNEENRKILNELGFREAPMHANAYEATWKLDITPSEEELLSKMRKTTRYLIRKTKKDPTISIKKSESLEDLKIYEKLTQMVAKRQSFVPFSFEFIKNEFEVFLKDKKVLCFLGNYKDEPVAGALVIFWSGVGFYHQAASNEKYAKLSIPYQVLWTAIVEAKKRNCKWFDFWGYVDPFKYPNHPWAGPTLFKMGFGGEKKEYVKTQDYPLNFSYLKNWTIEKVRKKKRKI
jgi:lipid II:glycine glycyltransferase (peptidoglycan interpeptide bridge formation enzyme)